MGIENKIGIEILACGGTWDAERIERVNSKEKYFFAETHIPMALRQGRAINDFNIETLMLKDSLEMTVEDRDLISKACKHSLYKEILIIHGTDTMVETAKYLGKNLSELCDKTIVLTGAIIPYKKIESDALFNLGFALSVVQTSPRGIYVAMNGRTFNWYNVEKNKEKGIFVERK